MGTDTLRGSQGYTTEHRELPKKQLWEGFVCLKGGLGGSSDGKKWKHQLECTDLLVPHPAPLPQARVCPSLSDCVG